MFWNIFGEAVLVIGILLAVSFLAIKAQNGKK